MRVALLSYNAQLHNAIGNHVAEKARFALERGAEVRVFVQDARRLHPDLHAITSEVAEVTSEDAVWSFLRQADLVIAVFAQASLLWQFLPMLTGLGPRILFDYHGVTPAEFAHEQMREGLRASQRERGYVWFADHAIATSEFTRQELHRATRCPLERITLLHLPVDTAHFHPKLGERYLHETLGIKGRILLYVGRLAGNKRVPILIDALAELADRTLHAVIVGDTSDVYAAEKTRCAERAQALGVADRVHFLSSVEQADLPRVYQSADVLVMPSLHEGFCIPVVEAMACGVPVIGAQCAALPETIADAGLTFVPDDAGDLVRQLRRVLVAVGHTSTRARRIAVVNFRFGSEIVGGAETSLGVMARALQGAGHDVHVFTTCTKSESHWTNELPAGVITLDGLHVERFFIDPHDAIAHGETVRSILDANGIVPPEIERRYIDQSIHSSKLIEALRERLDEFDAILVGPYLFGLTVDLVAAFSHRVLLVPCFHDEALARLAIWPQLYSKVGGVLYHSREEQAYAQNVLGVNSPNAREFGTFMALSPLPCNRGRGVGGEGDCGWQLEASPPSPPAPLPLSTGGEGRGCGPAPFPISTRGDGNGCVVYCGRYSEQKNVPLLLEWARRYQAERPGGLNFVFMGQGDVKLPSEPWLRDLGRVETDVKHAVLANARALVQLSTNESLSLVALEAWACETPVIAHRDCAVLRGQIERSQGGATVADYASFAAALDDLLANESVWRERGKLGRAFVKSKYGCAATYAQSLIHALDTMHQPMSDQMRASALRHAQTFSRNCWQERFTEVIDGVLSASSRRIHGQIEIESLRQSCESAAGMRSLLLPIRLRNEGTLAAASDGPGRTTIGCEIVDASTMQSVGAYQWIAIAALLAPGQSQNVALPIVVPDAVGAYRIRLWCERAGSIASAIVEIPLRITERADSPALNCTSSFVDFVQETLPLTQQLQQLPSDYVDVTEGRFASVKRWIKRKVLNNFKNAYVDRLSRQQSQVNGQVIGMIQQLAECCAMLDHAVQGLHRRLDGLENKIEQIATDATQSQREEIHG